MVEEEATAQRMKMNLELLQRLAVTWAANEEAQRKFRAVIVNRVAKIETTVQMILGAQITEAHDRMDSDKLREHAKGTDEYIAKASDKLGLGMIEFIYGEPRKTGRRRGRKRQESD
jgi:hypothetical protein